MTLADLYANIALENLITSAGECKCEAGSHIPEYPCSIEVVAMITFSCARGFKCCQSICEEIKEILKRGKVCPTPNCGKNLNNCLSIIPI